jgi:hypothetical protein
MAASEAQVARRTVHRAPGGAACNAAVCASVAIVVRVAVLAGCAGGGVQEGVEALEPARQALGAARSRVAWRAHCTKGRGAALRIAPQDCCCCCCRWYYGGLLLRVCAHEHQPKATAAAGLQESSCNDSSGRLAATHHTAPLQGPSACCPPHHSRSSPAPSGRVSKVECCLRLLAGTPRTGRRWGMAPCLQQGRSAVVVVDGAVAVVAASRLASALQESAARIGLCTRPPPSQQLVLLLTVAGFAAARDADQTVQVLVARAAGVAVWRLVAGQAALAVRAGAAQPAHPCRCGGAGRDVMAGLLLAWWAESECSCWLY